jgi:hypothetical protein
VPTALAFVGKVVNVLAVFPCQRNETILINKCPERTHARTDEAAYIKNLHLNWRYPGHEAVTRLFERIFGNRYLVTDFECIKRIPTIGMPESIPIVGELPVYGVQNLL